MFIVFLAINGLFLALLFTQIINGNFSMNLLLVGIILNVIYAILVFAIKPIRTVLTIWWAIIGLLDAAWWIYLLVSH
jgi:hypothetical protein